MNAKRRKASLITIAVSFLVIVIALYSLIELPEEGLYEGSANYLKSNPGIGTLMDVENRPDWAEGKRQWIKTDKGNFLLYLKNNEVVAVYIETGKGREEFWRKSGT